MNTRLSWLVLQLREEAGSPSPAEGNCALFTKKTPTISAATQMAPATDLPDLAEARASEFLKRSGKPCSSDKEVADLVAFGIRCRMGLSQSQARRYEEVVRGQ